MNLETEESAERDGKSLVCLLDDPAAELGRDTLFWHYPHYYPRMTPGSAVRDGDWKLIHYYEDDKVELFNLVSDPSETTDLSGENSDRVRQLRGLLDEWRLSTAANAPVMNPNWKATR